MARYKNNVEAQVPDKVVGKVDGNPVVGSVAAIGDGDKINVASVDVVPDPDGGGVKLSQRSEWVDAGEFLAAADALDSI